MALILGCILGIIVTALLGELAALRALVTDKESSFTVDFLVIAALASVALQLLLVPILEARSRLLKARKANDQGDTKLAAAVGLVAMSGLLLAVIAVPLAQVAVLIVGVL